MSSSRSPTRAGGWRPSCCRICSASTPRAGRGRRRATGSGWPSARGLVEAHGGRIRAESAGAGRGTTFTFTLPAAGEAGAEAPGRAAGPRHSDRERRVGRPPPAVVPDPGRAAVPHPPDPRRRLRCGRGRCGRCDRPFVRDAIGPDRVEFGGLVESLVPLTAYFGGSGTPISAEVEHRFRRKWNTDSGKWNTHFGGSGTPVPES